MNSLTETETHLLDSLSLPVMILDHELAFLYANKAYLDATHKLWDEIEGVYVFDAFPDTDDRIAAVLPKFKQTLSGATTTLDAQPFQLTLEDGSHKDVVWQATQDPIKTASGEVIGLIQRAEDVTYQFEQEQRTKAISYELSHRVKNIMAVVTSVARITGRNATDVASFVTNFTARLNAMSRTNDLLSKSDWRGLSVHAIFGNELAPYTREDDPAFALSGPKVRLSVDASKDLSMVCHELATNAAKYGCLSKDGGHLAIVWQRTGDQLVIEWRETCSRPIEVTERTGFGTRLFDMLPYATVERDFTPTGLHLKITLDGETVFA